MPLPVSAQSVYGTLGLNDSPVLIDVRSEGQRAEQPRIIPGARCRQAQDVQAWAPTLPHSPSVIVYSASCDECGRVVADALSSLGRITRQLAGGLNAWLVAGYPTVRARPGLHVPGMSRWITRERPKIDRLACPWLIRRFIDPQAQFFYTPPHLVRSEAKALEAEAYDIPEVTFSHRGSRCTFDALLDEFELKDPVLDQIAQIVRAADTGALEDAREAPGLLAISLGLSANIADDLLLLEQAMPIYDALYAWRKRAPDEVHSWPQPAR
jgi:rhodanese-related sulfurtransferase